MRMIGGQGFLGKTGRFYEAGKVEDIDHPDFREAQIAGWSIEQPGESAFRKGTRVHWEGGSGVCIANEVDAHVLVAAAGAPGDNARAVMYLAVGDLNLTRAEEPADVTGSGAV
jgi:hypothetical protein